MRILKNNYFTYGNLISTDYNAYIATSNMFDAPKRDVTTITVLGRNGNLHVDNGRFEAFRGKCTVFIPYDMYGNIDGLRNQLMSIGTAKYQECYRPNEYRMATFMDSFEVSKSDRKGAYFTLTFDCSPERWIESGQISTSITVGTSTIMYNAYQFDAKPLIEVTGTGTITINDVTLQLSTNTGTTIIDCDTQDCYEGSTNRNSNLTFVSGDEFPVLEPGENTILATGFTTIGIKPRWWTV